MVLDNLVTKLVFNMMSSAVFYFCVVNISPRFVRRILIKVDYSFQKSSATLLLLIVLSF